MNDKSDLTTNIEERRVVEQLWQELKPLHELVHAYIRQQMVTLYPDQVQLDQPIPIHLTSNQLNVVAQTIFSFSRGSIWFNDDIS